VVASVRAAGGEPAGTDRPGALAPREPAGTVSFPGALPPAPGEPLVVLGVAACAGAPFATGCAPLDARGDRAERGLGLPAGSRARRGAPAAGLRAADRCFAFERFVRVTAPPRCRGRDGVSPRCSGAAPILGGSCSARTTAEAGRSTGIAPRPASTRPQSQIENTAASTCPPTRSRRARRPVGSTRTGSAITAARPRRSVTRVSAPPTESSPVTVVITDEAPAAPQGWPVATQAGRAQPIAPFGSSSDADQVAPGQVEIERGCLAHLPYE
jgi:hypothetical protein